MLITRMDGKDVEGYLKQKCITELFQSLTVALVLHKPEDHLGFIKKCLLQVQDAGLTPDKVTWDTFITQSPSGRLQALGNLQVTNKTATHGKEKKVKMMLSQMSMVDDDLHTRSSVDLDIIEHDLGDGDVPEDNLARLHPRAWEILRGATDNLPAMPSNVVRIFLSSTFSDFKAERNILPREVYPVLQQFCSDLGLEFQVIDMRWGVTDEVIDDHQVSELCMQEILLCQQVSRGPNFVTLLGNRYGYQSFPAKIKADEFQIIKEVAEAEHSEDRGLLDIWFQRDANSTIPEYILQPIHHIIREYHNRGTSEEDRKKRAAASAEWQNIFNKLLFLIRHCVDTALVQNKMTQKERSKYYKSVTEEEVDIGLLRASNPESRVLAYVRDLDGLISRVNDQDASRFIDLVDKGQINDLAVSLRQKLIEEEVPKSLPQTNIRHYNVPWLGQSLECSEQDEYKNYLKNFTIDFLDDMMRLIRASVQEDYSLEMEQLQNLYQEVLHHNRFTHEKTQIFCGRQHEVSRIKTYLTKTKWNDHSPLILTGKSGYGKTALMAYVAKKAKEWMGDNTCVIARYLGTSPQSSNIGSTLKSLITQISTVNNLMLPNEDKMGTFSDIKQKFWSRLEKLGNSHRDPLLLVLDSVDQLQKTFGAYNMIWLPKRLPARVFIVVSMLSDRFEYLNNAKKRVTYPDNFLELNPLSVTSADLIMEAYLSRVGRTISNEQRDFIISKFQLCSQPLFLQLSLDFAKSWHSYTPLDDIKLGETVHSVINQLFAHLEKKQGLVFVRNALGYLTCSKGGMSGLELEDVLSCDDDVLNEVYQYHDPPVENLIRIPSLLWSRLQYSLKDYLAERQVDGKTVLAWYHRQFWETAEDRYLQPKDGENLAEKLHSNLADIYLQENGIQRTIVLNQRNSKVLKDCDRGIAPQPLHSKNLRKLRALPYHLIAAKRIETLKKKCILNFEWVLIKLHAYDTFDVLREYENVYLPAVSDADVSIFRDFLALCADAIWADPLLLAYNCIERLSVYFDVHPALQLLVFDAKQWLATTSNPVLIPTHKVNFQNPESPLKLDLLCGCDGVLSPDESTLACKWQEKTAGTFRVNVVNVKNKEVLTSINTGKANYYTISKDGLHLIYADQLVLHIREIDSGDKVKSISYEKRQYERLTVRCLALSENDDLVAVGFRHGKPLDLQDNEVWKSGAMLVIINLPLGKVMGTMKFSPKKSLDAVHFISNDKQVIVTTRERLLIIDISSMETIVQFSPAAEEICSTLSHIFREDSLLAVAVKTTSNAKVLLYDYKIKETHLSERLHMKDSEHIHPVAFFTKDTEQKIVVVTCDTQPNCTPDSCLCIWDRSRDKYKKVHLSPQGVKIPTAVAMTANWEYAFVGWANGDVVIVDLNMDLELYDLKIQGQAINFMRVVKLENTLITISSDHSVKVWKIDVLLARAQHDWERKHSMPVIDDLSITPILSEAEECLDYDVIGHYLVTVPPENNQAPKFWNLRDGRLNEEISNDMHNEYNAGCKNNKIKLNGRTHGEVELLEDEMFVYTRAKRNELLVCVNVNLEEPKLVCMRQIKNAFFKHFAKVPPEANAPPEWRMYVVMDSSLDVYSLPDLNRLGSVSIPALSKEIPNIYSSGGKKKLMFYRTGVTTDGKYFVLLNPGTTSIGKNTKPFDLIDLHKLQYTQRTDMPKHVNFTLMSDSFCVLVWNKNPDHDTDNSCDNVQHIAVSQCLDSESSHKEEISGVNNHKDNTDEIKNNRHHQSKDEPLVLPPQAFYQLSNENFRTTYQCLLLTNANLISRNYKYGLEIKNKKRIVNIWTTDPLEKLHTLKGHVHEITSAQLSNNNEFVVTGSCDKTVRVWRVRTGLQLCTFHVDGSVSDVRFDITASYVAVHSYAAPQRKRAIILRIQNSSARRKLSRYFSKQDF